MDKLSKPDDLKSLGAAGTQYKYDEADPLLLERFPNPMAAQRSEMAGGVLSEILIVAPEFTSLCPKTGQPDFATIRLTYAPRGWCVESKSYKLYLGSYRMVGEFHEACVEKIRTDLVNLLDPYFLEVVGEFTPRGGISFWPRSWFRALDCTKE